MGRTAALRRTIRTASSPTLITHDAPRTRRSRRDRKSVPQMDLSRSMWPSRERRPRLVVGWLRSPPEVWEAVQARGQPIADGHPDVNADHF
jgi:hypothetical protein